jgi:hypothetical protein
METEALNIPAFSVRPSGCCQIRRTDVRAKENAKRESSLIMRQMLSFGPRKPGTSRAFFDDLGAPRKGRMLDFNQGAMGSAWSNEKRGEDYEPKRSPGIRREDQEPHLPA